MASSSEAPESGGASRTLHGVEMKHSAKVNVYHVTVNHRCCVMFKMFGFLRTYFLFLNYTLGLLLSASIHTCTGAHTRVKNYTNLWLHYCFQISAKDCGGLATPTNGSSRGSLTTYPHEVTFKCDEGFNLRGSRIRQCLSSGNWSGNETTCEGNVKNRMPVVTMMS